MGNMDLKLRLDILDFIMKGEKKDLKCFMLLRAVFELTLC